MSFRISSLLISSSKNLSNGLRNCAYRCESTAAAIVPESTKKSNFLFSQEQRRQHESIGRIEKIEVTVKLPSEDTRLSMNQNISTPYDCVRHISEAVVNQSALALVDGDVLWDMHRPLEKSCSMKLLHFKDQEPHFVNKAFWRTCSVVLGAVITNSFKDNVKVLLHSFPSPNVRSGSFIYDVELGLTDWNPKEDEMRILSSEMIKFSQKNHKLERLSVSRELALEIFENNPHKQEQIPKIAAQNEGNQVILYRLGDHIDVSRGPMVGFTSFIGRCTVTSVHKIETEYGDLYRFQGVALPKGIMLNHFAYSILEDRAKRLNPGRFPGAASTFSEDYEAVAA